MRAGRLGTSTQFGHEWLGLYVAARTPVEFQAIYDTLTQEEQEVFGRVCSNLPCARAFFEAHTEQYGWCAGMIERSKVFTPRKLNSEVAYFPKPWNCFVNSFDAASAGSLRYVEGIGISPFGPMPHAWLTSDGTDVYDFTWPYQHINKYFGMELDTFWMEANNVPAGFTGYLYNARTPMETPRASQTDIEKWSRVFDAEFKRTKGA